MTREDINDIINAICPNDKDYEKPCISPKYLRQELEQLALDQKQWNGEPTTKNDLADDKTFYEQIMEYCKEHFLVLVDKDVWDDAEKALTTKNNLAVDCIDRAKAQTKIEMNASRYTIAKEREGMGQVEWSDQLIKVSDAIDIIRNLPPVTPQLSSELEKNSKKLEKDFGELDCISREQVLEQVDKWRDYEFIRVTNPLYYLKKRLNDLPSVTPIKGHWINKYHSFESCSAECSSCHKRSNGYMHDNGFSLECKYYDFCPKCGSNNREVEE